MTSGKLQISALPLNEIDNVARWGDMSRAGNYPVFYSPHFLNCIATAPLLATDSSTLLLLEDESGVVAGFPVFRQSNMDPIRHLTPIYGIFPDLPKSSAVLSHCWHCYDSRIVTARTGTESDSLVKALCQYARSVDADYFGLVNVSDPLTLEVMQRAGISPHYMTDRYIMNIAGYSGFDDYLAALHPDARRECRRQYKHYEASMAELAIEQPPFDDIEEVVRLCRATAARYEAEFYYPEEPTRFLLANLGPSLRLISIRIQGERIGVLICFFDPPRLHIWAAGMRYDRSAFSPYAISIAEAIRYAIDTRMTMIEGGRGNGRIKKKQGFVPLRLHACLQRTKT